MKRYYVRENSEEANELLYDKYKPLIEKNARRLLKYCNYNGLELNDLIQEGMIGVFKAITSFNGKSSFKAYAYTCIKTNIITAIKKSNRNKNKPLNNYISLSGTDGNDEDKNLLVCDKNFDPERKVIEMESHDELRETIKQKLSQFEYKILLYYLQGFSYSDISERTGKKEKSIDNAIQRIRKKLQELNG